VAPFGEKAQDLIKELTGQVQANALVSAHTCTKVTQFEGYVGNFKLGLEKQPPSTLEGDRQSMPHDLKSLKPGDYVPFAGVYPQCVPSAVEKMSLQTGVIVLATGFETYRPRRGEYGYEEFEQVITLTDLIRSLATAEKEGSCLVVGGRKIRSMAMIHCVGSRQIPGIHPEDESGCLNEYCSRTCCSATLNTANVIREAYPGTRVYEFYRDIRTYGRGQEELYDRASHNKVVFLRFEAEESPRVVRSEGPDGFPLQVEVKDTLTFGEQVDVPTDLVVLATGMVPTGISELVEMMKLPVGADRFLLEVHPKLRPVELPQAGILLAGTCQAPMDVGEACNAAGGAAVKASAMLGRGYVELDPFVAEVNLEKCEGSGACVEACPADGALQLVDVEIGGRRVRRARVTPALCMGCGACVAVCPQNAIDINGWTLKQYEAMVARIAAEDEAA
jgi:heterodisulfide reductase subunit A